MMPRPAPETEVRKSITTLVWMSRRKLRTLRVVMANPSRIAYLYLPPTDDHLKLTKKTRQDNRSETT